MHHQGQTQDGCVQSRCIVGQIGVDFQRRCRGAGTVQIHIAAHCLTGNVVSCFVLIGAILTITGNMDDGQFRVQVLPDELIGQTHLCIRTGTAGLNPNVSPCQQFLEHFLAAFAVGIHCHCKAVSVLLCVTVVAAGGAGHFGMLDLNDLGAHLSHNSACKRTGNVHTGGNDLQTGQNTKLGVLVELHMSSIVIGIVLRHSCNLPFFL